MEPGLIDEDFSRDVYLDATRYVTGVAHSLVVRYGAVLNKGQLKRLVRKFEKITVPRERRGRKNLPLIDAAYQDFLCGRSIAEIAEIHIRGYCSMNSYRKKAVRKRLQAAFRGREKKRRQEFRELFRNTPSASGVQRIR